MFGAGPGGAHVIILGAMALYASFQMTALRGVDVASFFPPSGSELGLAQVEAHRLLRGPWRWPEPSSVS